MAPALTFRSIFEEEGVPVTDAEAREPMGMHKRVRSGPAETSAAADAELGAVRNWSLGLCENQGCK